MAWKRRRSPQLEHKRFRVHQERTPTISVSLKGRASLRSAIATERPRPSLPLQMTLEDLMNLTMRETKRNPRRTIRELPAQLTTPKLRKKNQTLNPPSP